MIKILAFLLATQFQVGVKVADQPLKQYQDGPIELPTDRYACHVEKTRDPNHYMVSVECTEKGQHVLTVSAICRTDKPDQNIAAALLNVSKDEKPNPVFFMVGCRSVPGPEIL